MLLQKSVKSHKYERQMERRIKNNYKYGYKKRKDTSASLKPASCKFVIVDCLTTQSTSQVKHIYSATYAKLRCRSTDWIKQNRNM